MVIPIFSQPVKTSFFVPFTLLLCLLAASGHGQKPKKKLKSGGTVQLNDSLTSFGQSDIFTFPNINTVPNYYDSKKLRKLQELKKSGETNEYYLALKGYVGNFGIENFHDNTAMIWGLAQLSAKVGPPGESVLLYKLVLKHHRQGLNIADVFREYDSLERDKMKYYVPLEYYYQLVAYRKEIDTLRPPHKVLVNMGDNLNSLKEDYGPTIGNVDNLMLFTSKRNKQNLDNRQYDEDLFYSERIDSIWMPAKAFDKINTTYNEGSACLSLDGKYLIFSRCNAADSQGNCDLYMAERPSADSTWRKIHNMGPAINSSGWDSHPSLTHSGDTLFFASNRVGSFGLSDIFFSIKNPGGKTDSPRC